MQQMRQPRHLSVRPFCEVRGVLVMCLIDSRLLTLTGASL